MYSELISNAIAGGGPFASKTSFVKLLRSVKRETLKLIETFLDKAEDQPHIARQFVPPMMDPVLGDYARNVPDARESEVLSLFATIINKYKAAMIDDVPRIFEAVFQCTLEARRREEKKERKRLRKEKRKERRKTKKATEEKRSKSNIDRPQISQSFGSVKPKEKALTTSPPAPQEALGATCQEPTITFSRKLSDEEKGKQISLPPSGPPGDTILALATAEGAEAYNRDFARYLSQVMPDFPVEQLFQEGFGEEGLSENEKETIPARSPRFTGADKANMIKEWMRDVPEGYQKFLKGCELGYLGPIKGDLANCLIRLDGLSKVMAQYKAENKRNIRLARHCRDYVMNHTSKLARRHQDAMDAMQTDLTFYKDKYNEALVRADQLAAEKIVFEKNIKQFEFKANESKEKIEDLQKKVHDLSTQATSSKADAEYWKNNTAEAVMKVEKAMRANIEEAWGMMTSGPPYKDFLRRLDFVVAKKATEIEGSPALFVSTPDLIEKEEVKQSSSGKEGEGEEEEESPIDEEAESPPEDKEESSGSRSSSGSSSSVSTDDSSSELSSNGEEDDEKAGGGANKGAP